MAETLDDEAWRIEVVQALDAIAEKLVRQYPATDVRMGQLSRIMKKLWADLEARNDAALDTAFALPPLPANRETLSASAEGGDGKLPIST